jgi:Holliday junction DNA helicase RuvB
MYEPKNLTDFIGQSEVKQQVEIVISTARNRGEPCPHMIFYGGAGLGKTALGKIISSEMGGRLVYTVGNTVQVERELMLLREFDVLFIDELHRLKPTSEEVLYPPLTEGKLYLSRGLYDNAIELYPFTFIGATTSIGSVSKPLRDRCMLNLNFVPYPLQDVFIILKQAANRSSIPIMTSALHIIARVSRGIPRIGLKILGMAFNVMENGGFCRITDEIAEDTLDILQIREDGLTLTDIKYMQLLFESNRPIGQKAIATALGIDTKTLVDVIEPFLMETGYVLLTDRGRILTRKGVDVLHE